VPKLQELYFADASSYLQRITVLYGIRDMASSPAFADVTNDLLPLLLRSLRDAVPNVRFVGSQILGDAIACGAFDRSRVISDVRPALEALKSDSDPDVRYFSTIALERC
jgi:hypothetical protein